MTKQPTKTLDDLFDEYEKERLAQIERDQVEYDKPENVAKRKASAEAEHAKGVRLGWWDADGNPLTEESNEEESNEEESEDED